MAGYYLENFGCRATQADGAAIERDLLARGLEPSAAAAAGVAVLNTCTVTASADADARAAIRRIHRENPECRIVVTGCYAQRSPEEIALLPGVAAVVGNSHKSQVAKVAAGMLPPGFARAVEAGPAAAAFAGGGGGSFVPLASLGGMASVAAGNVFVGDIFAHTELLAAPVFEGAGAWARTRPNLKVQDGCDNRCSFCVIPFVRGSSRSLPLEAVVREARALVEAGFREMVISGINLGRWGRDFERVSRFEALVEALLEQTEIERLRISSVEPMDWSDELIALVAGSPRIVKHAHVPLQSGSDRVLRRMHRKYRPWHYAEKIEKIRRAMPEAAIGADVMTGFPGETEAEFEESRSFIAALPFTYLHVFTYSARPGTAAAAMPAQVAVHVARQRNRTLRELAAEKNLDFRRSFVGRELEAITLGAGIFADGETKTSEALTGNYLKLRLEGAFAPNQMVRARITETTADGVAGNVIGNVAGNVIGNKAGNCATTDRRLS